MEFLNTRDKTDKELYTVNICVSAPYYFSKSQRICSVPEQIHHNNLFLLQAPQFSSFFGNLTVRNSIFNAS